MTQSRIVLRAAACALVVFVTTSVAVAERPEGVVRTFAVGVNSVSVMPDFLSDESLAVVVAPGGPPEPDHTLRFEESGNCDERFDASVWVYQEAMHIKVGGAEIPGGVYWLLTPETPEPPPTGAITFTGADSSSIISQEDPVWYESPGSRYRIRCSPGGAGLLLVVTAVFSR